MSAAEDTAPVALRVDGRVAVATLDNPPANALSLALADGLATALEHVATCGARVLVVRSALPGFFAAGADLKLLGGADAEAFAAYLERLRGCLEQLAALPLVTIAAVDGHALGGGLELAAACTLRVAGPEARFGVPEVKLGLLPGAGGTQRLPRLVGRGAALDLLLTGRSADADEALRIGLIDRLGPDGADAEAARLAEQLARLPGPALAAVVRCADAARDLPLSEGMRVERDEILALFDTPQAREGLAAFLEKRPPDFGS